MKIMYYRIAIWIFAFCVCALVLAFHPQWIGKVAERRAPDRPLFVLNDVSRIRLHSWWKTPPTEKQVDDLAQFICDSNAADRIYIDDECRFDLAAIWNEKHGFHQSVPAGLNSRCICFTFNQRLPKRPNRDQVLVALIELLDKAEFRDGPIRNP